jgi:hypothetical protein
MATNPTPPVIFIEGEEDNLEVLADLEEFLGDADESREENKYAVKVSPRVQKLRDIRKVAKVSIKQGRQFLAGVELDIKRKNENILLIEDLYIHWCNNGNRTWLSPQEIISKYEEVLLLFNGKRTSIAPFVQNLTSLAEQKISPHAFLRYVQNPRMGADFNWRDWGSKHLPSLKLIAEILIELKKSPPFDIDILGTEIVRMARDIVLVKYAGKPLAKFPEDVLKTGTAISEYKQNWSKLRLNNSAFLFFLKRNILPILYVLSGKVDLPHLNRILVRLPELEDLFRENFPEGYLSNYTPAIYGNDFEKGFEERRSKGYKYYDFVVETESFLKILCALLKTSSGYFLLPWFSKILLGRKDPDLADKIAVLVNALDDRGGKHTYSWHTRKILTVPANGRDAYIELVRANNGVDPAYPNYRALFTHPEESYENTYLLQLAQKLGIPLSQFGPAGTIISFRDLLNAYTKNNPPSAKILEKFRTEVTTGADRLWDLSNIAEFDSLGDAVHPLFIRSVIRGLGLNFSSGLKASNFSNLYKLFPVSKPNPFSIETEFKIPMQEIANLDKFKEEEVAKKVNRKLIISALSAFLEDSPVSPDNFVPFLNEESIQLRETDEAKTEEQKKLELEVKHLEENGNADKAILKQQKDAIKKLEKSLSFIREKRNHYEEILTIFPRLNDDEKFLVSILIAGFITEPGTDLYSFAIAIILFRYREELRLNDQLKYLREDIVLETLNYTQVCYFMNMIELCKNLLQTDKELNKIQSDSEHRLHELLKPYIITKNKKLSSESIDAAFNKLCACGKLNSERSKWQDILENTEKKLKEKYSSYKLIISKTSLDAYYGDMGGICLSGFPGEIRKEGFYVIRLINEEDGLIVGMSIAILTNGGIASQGIKSYWAVFAFNPLSSLLSSYSYRNQLYIYLQYRKVLERLSSKTGIPVVMVGVDTHGIVSNNASFRDMILRYEERKKKTASRLNDANGISLYYDESNYRKALLIIDTADKATFTSESAIKLYGY